MSVVEQGRSPQGAKGFDMGKRWFLNGMRRVVTSSLSFTDNSGVRYFDQTWLRKATDIVGGEEREYELK